MKNFELARFCKHNRNEQLRINKKQSYWVLYNVLDPSVVLGVWRKMPNCHWAIQKLPIYKIKKNEKFKWIQNSEV